MISKSYFFDDLQKKRPIFSCINYLKGFSLGFPLVFILLTTSNCMLFLSNCIDGKASLLSMSYDFVFGAFPFEEILMKIRSLQSALCNSYN